MVDCAYYSGGARQPGDAQSLEEAAAHKRRGNNFVWIELYEPSRELMAEVSSHFGLHELAVEDAAHAHQRPKVEPYDDFYFIVYRAARYDKPTNRVVFTELDLFLGAGFVIAVRHGEPADPERARRHLEQTPHLLKSGPTAAVWAILDTIVDDYAPVLDGLEEDIEDVERAIFGGGENLTEQIYLLKQEINEVYRAVHPLLAPLDVLERGGFEPVDPGLLRYFRDIADHVRRIQEEIFAQRDQLISVLEAHLSLINIRQSEIAAEQNVVVRRLTLVSTVFLPLTFITGFYGQNFGWLVRHVDSFEAFAVFGLAGLLIPFFGIFAWFKRGGYL
ncbi:MAG TPA: magnesium and cobalt transport protein CorA [Gaiellaceae bacterium]|nr:magnesium and cobalt transport protein CorA [Gaiellaceae bacterium]